MKICPLISFICKGNHQSLSNLFSFVEKPLFILMVFGNLFKCKLVFLWYNEWLWKIILPYLVFVCSSKLSIDFFLINCMFIKIVGQDKFLMEWRGECKVKVKNVILFPALEKERLVCQTMSTFGLVNGKIQTNLIHYLVFSKLVILCISKLS